MPQRGFNVLSNWLKIYIRVCRAFDQQNVEESVARGGIGWDSKAILDDGREILSRSPEEKRASPSSL